MTTSSHNIREDFPIFRDQPELVYLDSAATSLTPASVTDAMHAYYHNYNANVSRGVYHLSEKATQEYESVRLAVQSFIGAARSEEIIFTSGTTASINLIAHGLMGAVQPGDTIVATAMDHHANFVPWQQIATERNAQFDVLPITQDGQLDLAEFEKYITEKTVILALPYISNVLGTINPIKDIVQKARAINPAIFVIIDAAQAVAHMPIDVQDLGADFIAFSGHKMYGPTGIGILWGTYEKLDMLTPFVTGGEMIQEVTSAQTTYRDLPYRLEAGTPNIAGVIGLGAAISFVKHLFEEGASEHENALLLYARQELTGVFGTDITLYGPENLEIHAPVQSFSIDGLHPHDAAAIVNTSQNVCVRAGNHCAMPLHIESLSVAATTRLSIGSYNTHADIDKLIVGLQEAQNILQA